MLVFKITYLDGFLYSSSSWSLYQKKKKAAMMDSLSKGFKKILKILVHFRDLQEEFQLR